MLGIVAANLADTIPTVGLSFLALMLINVIFFYVWPMSDRRIGKSLSCLQLLPVGQRGQFIQNCLQPFKPPFMVTCARYLVPA